MAHGRDGPDIVMTIRYAGASEIRAVTDHEINRSVDGSSAIDPVRTHLNEILHGPSTQQEAVQEMWSQGVRKPTAQAEEPFVQIVLSASPQYFREEGQGPGEWDQEKLDQWKVETLSWLKGEYGDDLAHASLHLDEDTPHMHVLVVPTYSRKTRKPSRRKKSGETDAEFAHRLDEWENSPGSIRTAGRSSSDYWSRMWCRLEARKSYHKSMVSLGLGYGKDFAGLDEDSPQRKATGKWVREQAAALAEREAVLAKREAEVSAKSDRVDVLTVGTLALIDDMKTSSIYRDDAGEITSRNRKLIEAALPELNSVVNAAADVGTVILKDRSAIKSERADLERRESILGKSVQLFETLVSHITQRLGVSTGRTVKMSLRNIKAALASTPEPKISALDQMEEARRLKSSIPEEPGPDGPGL